MSKTMRRMQCDKETMLRIPMVVALSCMWVVAHADNRLVCSHYQSVLATGQWGKVSQTLLNPRQYTGGKPGDEHYANVDLDGDDISDAVSLSCSSSDKPSDPCYLDFELFSGKKVSFSKEYFLGLYRWHGRVYAIGSDDETRIAMRVYGFSRVGITRICTISRSGEGV